MRVSDFDFDLPDELIALRPANPRDSARLLVANDRFHDKTVSDLPSVLQTGDLLVFNDTRVIPARLFGKRGDAKVEALLHKAVTPDTWECYAKPAKRLKPGQTIDFSNLLHAAVIEKNADDGTVMLRFNMEGDELREAFEMHGSMPLPPYIARNTDANDRHDYQTMFAQHDGSVAAPTASLHYTPALMEKLKAAGIDWCTITLHVGAGTFMPVRVDDTDDHKMHAEVYNVTPEAAAKINEARKAGRRIIPVGTTALRTLESVTGNSNGDIISGSGETRLFITPGYQFKIASALLTNFHLPKSTLLMLVSAFCGMDRARAMYQHAIANNYRFYSYGDTSLLFPDR
ncbi:MAG: tRNA preQ1(34) S-adenosylmethionine ribosyltransferase-isomerase QueA [Bdellovibrionales bacterium]